MQPRKYETEVLVNGRDVSVVVEYDYQPPECCTRDYPGCDAEVTIIAITDSYGHEVYISDRHMEELEDTILEEEIQSAIDEREMRDDHLYEVAREARLCGEMEDGA